MSSAQVSRRSACSRRCVCTVDPRRARYWQPGEHSDFRGPRLSRRRESPGRARLPLTGDLAALRYRPRREPDEARHELCPVDTEQRGHLLNGGPLQPCHAGAGQVLVETLSGPPPQWKQLSGLVGDDSAKIDLHTRRRQTSLSTLHGPGQHVRSRHAHRFAQGYESRRRALHGATLVAGQCMYMDAKRKPRRQLGTSPPKGVASPSQFLSDRLSGDGVGPVILFCHVAFTPLATNHRYCRVTLPGHNPPRPANVPQRIEHHLFAVLLHAG